ncbi:MAG: FecR family protein [Leptolyngbyaceae cyanobacterium bins.59]|nr:FecR family protein [Leptolyngbyaceae cyanobacterium bins.59]
MQRSPLSLFCTGCISLSFGGLLSGCFGVSSTSGPIPSPSPTVSAGSPSLPPSLQATAPTATPPAKIVEIFQQPVFVKRSQASQEVAGKTGMGLQVGETVRTKGQALAQINLKNGLGFRIGRNASLTIQPDNKLNFTSGEMITWVEPGKKVPAQIVTPTAVAGIRGTTVFVKVPEDVNGETTFFAWEGTVSVRLPNNPTEIILNTGEEVQIRRGERDIAQVRRRIRRFRRQEMILRRRDSLLFRNFQQPLPTHQIIEQAIRQRRQ